MVRNTMRQNGQQQNATRGKHRAVLKDGTWDEQPLLSRALATAFFRAGFLNTPKFVLALCELIK